MLNEAKQQVLQAFERGQLLRLMSESGGNVSSAARLAGKERRALGKLLKKHGMAPEDFRDWWLPRHWRVEAALLRMQAQGLVCRREDADRHVVYVRADRSSDST